MKNYSNETIMQIVNAINANKSYIQSMKDNCIEKTVEDAAQELLIEKYGLAQIEAEEIVEDLKKGISEFDDQMAIAKTGEGISTKENLSKLSEGMNETERTEYYASILTALQLLSSSDKTESEIQEKLESNKKLSTEELISEITKAVNEGISLEVIGSSVKESVNAEVISELASKIDMNKGDFRLNAAVWLYILQRDGQIKLTESEIAIPATTVGTLAAAAIETIVTTNEYIQGNISLEKWQVIMKWILGAVVFAGLLVASIALVAYGTISFLSLLLSIFGTSTLALWISFVLSIALAWSWSGPMSDLQMMIIEWLSAIYDKHIASFTNKVLGIFASLKSIATKAFEVVKDKVEEASEAVVPNESTATTENEVQPALA